MFKKFFQRKSILPQEENWISFLRDKLDFYDSIKLNYSFKNIFPIKNYNKLIYFSLELNELMQKNFEIIYKIEDKISEILEEKLLAFFVGSLKSKTKFNLYFYTKNTENLYEIIEKIMIQFPEVQFSVSSFKDKKWKYYKEILPTNFELQRVLNEEKILNLKKENFDFRKKREVSYFLSFKKEEIFFLVKSDIKLLEFKIVEKGKTNKKGFKYVVKLQKKSKIDLKNLNENTRNLCNLADKYNFKYEGLIIN